MNPVLYLLPTVVLLLLVAANQHQQQARANQLAARVRNLVRGLEGRPLDLFDSPAGRKLLTPGANLDRIESKVRFLEKHHGIVSLYFTRRFWDANQRLKNLEERVERLERSGLDTARPSGSSSRA